jgi:regulator of replication initiation timing
MKKFILVMIFVLLTALFIAFNYLLWDRENKIAELKNLETANASYTTNINAQKREISSLEEEIDRLENQIKQLESDRDRLSEEKSTIQVEWAATRESLQERIDFINILKQYADINILSDPVVKWVEAINQGDFKQAYFLEYEGVEPADRAVRVEEYVEQMSSSIRRIEITQMKVDKLRGSGNGDIFLNVTLDVKLPEEPDMKSLRFTEGVNEIYVKIDYSIPQKAFIISAIGNV